MLDPEVIKEEFLKFADAKNEAFPESMSEAITAWADMLVAYAKTVSPPSTGATSAKAAFEAAMASVTVQAKNWPIVFPTALTAFGTALGAGMAGYTGTPKGQPYVFADVMAVGIAGGSIEDVAEILSSTLHTWFRGGRASNSNGIVGWR